MKLTPLVTDYFGFFALSLKPNHNMLLLNSESKILINLRLCICHVSVDVLHFSFYLQFKRLNDYLI